MDLCCYMRTLELCIPIIAEMLRDASQRQGIIDETNQCIKVVKYNSVVCVATLCETE